MSVRLCLDTNVLIYQFDFYAPAKQKQAQDLVTAAGTRNCVLGLQSMGEFYSVVTRMRVLSPAEAAKQVNSFLTLFGTFAATDNAHRIAAREAAAGRLGYWDAVLLASADEAGCEVMLSEDMRDGARLGGITVRNTFGARGLTDAARAALDL